MRPERGLQLISTMCGVQKESTLEQCQNTLQRKNQHLTTTQKHLLADSSGWGRSRRHRNKVDTLRRRGHRLLQIVVTLRKQSHYVNTHALQCICVCGGCLGKNCCAAEACWSLILPTQPDLQRLVALLTPTVLIWHVCARPLHKHGEAVSGTGATTCAGEVQRAQGLSVYQQNIDSRGSVCVCVWSLPDSSSLPRTGSSAKLPGPR